MARVILLVVLAACWTSAPIVERDLNPSRPRVLKRRPQCWTPEFHEQWPARADFYETLHGCQAEWDDHAQAAVCFAWRINAAYEQLDMWVARWFEACDPSYRGRR